MSTLNPRHLSFFQITIPQLDDPISSSPFGINDQELPSKIDYNGQQRIPKISKKAFTYAFIIGIFMAISLLYANMFSILANMFIYFFLIPFIYILSNEKIKHFARDYLQ